MYACGFSLALEISHSTENARIHLRNFLAKCDIIKFNRVSADVIRLTLFPFLLMDKVSYWLLNDKPNSFTTLEALSRAFPNEYFSPSKTAKLRAAISTFSQRGNESLYEAWERFKDLQR